MVDCGNPVSLNTCRWISKLCSLLIDNTVKIYVTERNLVFQKKTNAFLLRSRNFFNTMSWKHNKGYVTILNIV